MEDKMAQKPTRKIDKTIMDNFYKLVHPKQNVRLTAARSTFKILQSYNKNSEATNDSLNYCVERLVSGLASSRDNARNGFGVLLLEILENMKVSIDRLFNIAEAKFGNINKDIHKDNIFGWFLLVNIILKSGIVKTNKKNETKHCSRVYKILQQLRKIKTYMEVPICNVIHEYVELFIDFIPDDLPRSVLASDTKLSTYSMFLAFVYNKHIAIPELNSLEESDLPILTTLIMDAAAYKPYMHPVIYLANELILKNRNKLFDKFFKNVVQPALYVKDHSDLAELGFQLITNLIRSDYCKTSNVRTLLNEHIIRTCIMHASKKDSRLFKAVNDFFNSLVDYSKENTGSKLSDILDALTESPGSLDFDNDSRSTIIQQLLMHSPADVLKKYILKLENALLYKDLKDKTIISCARQLAFIVKRPQFAKEDDAIENISRFLLTHSLFIVKVGSETLTKPIRPFSSEVRQSFRDALYIVIDHIISSSTPEDRYQKIESLIVQANSLMRMDNEEVEYICPTECDIVETLKKWRKYFRKTKSFPELLEQGKNLKELHALLLLFHFYGFQILEHGLDVSNELNDLTTCLTKAATGDVSDPCWADVVTDLIVGVLSSVEFSHVFRKIAETVLSNIIPHLTSASGESIFLAMGGNQEECEDSDDESMDCDPQDVKTTKRNTETNQGASLDRLSLDGDNESVSSEEITFDDDQMMKFDDALSELFKLKREAKSSKDEKSKHQLALKLRCLDLVRKIMFKKEANLELIDSLVKYLVPLVKSSKKDAANRPVADKILMIFRKSPHRTKNEKIKNLLLPKVKKLKKHKDKPKEAKINGASTKEKLKTKKEKKLKPKIVH